MATETIVTTQGVYFITFTCHDWLSLIDITNAYEAVYNFFDVLKEKGNPVVGYVIMPNHLHLLLHYTDASKTLNSYIANGKRFMAYSIVEKLYAMKQSALLQKLEAAVDPKDRSRGKKHQVWKRGFEVKECRTEKFLLQKLNYIHDNPVRGRWHLTENRSDYPHSSCLFYFTGQQRRCEVVHYEQVLDWEHMYE